MREDHNIRYFEVYSSVLMDNNQITVHPTVIKFDAEVWRRRRIFPVETPITLSGLSMLFIYRNSRRSKSINCVYRQCISPIKLF